MLSLMVRESISGRPTLRYFLQPANINVMCSRLFTEHSLIGTTAPLLSHTRNLQLNPVKPQARPSAQQYGSDLNSDC